MRICLEAPEAHECRDTVFPSALSKYGLPAVNASLLKVVAQEGPEAAVACHVVSEDLGEIWAQNRGVAALDELEYSCLGGPMHGVFYTLGLQLDARDLATRSKGLCEKFARGKPWVVGWDCRHGVGHAVGLDADLPAQDAFALCQEVYEVASDRVDCASGVMGSILARLGEGGEVKGIEVDDPLGWCRSSVPEEMTTMCAVRAPAVLFVTGTPLERLADKCPAGDLDCFYGVGYVAGIPDGPWQPPARARVCLDLQAGMDTACMAGLIRNITPDYRLVEKDPQVCAASGRLRGVCLAETEKMNLRELTLAQLMEDNSSAYRGPSDPAPWPRAGAQR